MLLDFHIKSLITVFMFLDYMLKKDVRKTTRKTYSMEQPQAAAKAVKSRLP
jgi:hypothetical protein